MTAGISKDSRRGEGVPRVKNLSESVESFKDTVVSLSGRHAIGFTSADKECDVAFRTNPSMRMWICAHDRLLNARNPARCFALVPPNELGHETIEFQFRIEMVADRGRPRVLGSVGKSRCHLAQLSGESFGGRLMLALHDL